MLLHSDDEILTHYAVADRLGISFEETYEMNHHVFRGWLAYWEILKKTEREQ